MADETRFDQQEVPTRTGSPRDRPLEPARGNCRDAYRIVGVISAILNLLFIGAYPIWSTIVIAVDVIVIYAIVVHGRELKA